MPSRIPMLSFLLASLAALPARAEGTERYVLAKTEDGYVRMDTQTGAISMCEESDGSLTCRMASDERSAADGEIARLRDQVKSLDARVAKLEQAPAATQSGLPSEEDFNRSLNYMDRFLRTFMDVVKENERNETPKALPQKT